MKRFLFVLLILAILAMAAGEKVKLVRLTIENKSDYVVYIMLQGVELEQRYFLKIEKGSRDWPSERVYTILPDVYRWNITYLIPEGDLLIPIAEEYREIEIFSRMHINLLEPTLFVNNCDPEAEFAELFTNKNCSVDYFVGEAGYLKLVPLGVWNYRY